MLLRRTHFCAPLTDRPGRGPEQPGQRIGRLHRRPAPLGVRHRAPRAGAARRRRPRSGFAPGAGKMTGVVVVSHGNLGNTFKNEIENILDHPVRLKTVAVSYRASVEHTLAVIHEAIRAAIDGQGVLLLTDLPSATQHNLACQAAQETNIPVVSGVDLYYLLKVHYQ